MTSTPAPSGDCGHLTWPSWCSTCHPVPRTPTAVEALADAWEASLKVTFHTEGEARIVAEHVAQLRTLAGDPA